MLEDVRCEEIDAAIDGGADERLRFLHVMGHFVRAVVLNYAPVVERLLSSCLVKGVNGVKLKGEHQSTCHSVVTGQSSRLLALQSKRTLFSSKSDGAYLRSQYCGGGFVVRSASVKLEHFFQGKISTNIAVHDEEETGIP